MNCDAFRCGCSRCMTTTRHAARRCEFLLPREAHVRLFVSSDVPRQHNTRVRRPLDVTSCDASFRWVSSANAWKRFMAIWRYFAHTYSYSQTRARYRTCASFGRDEKGRAQDAHRHRRAGRRVRSCDARDTTFVRCDCFGRATDAHTQAADTAAMASSVDRRVKRWAEGKV